MKISSKQRPLVTRKAFLPLAALAAVSCADILGFEHGHGVTDDAGQGGATVQDGAAIDVRSGDASVDGGRNDAGGRGGNAGATAGSGGTGGSDAGGGTAGAGASGGKGGAGASGGTGGAGASGGTGGAGASGGTGGAGASGGTGGAGASGGTGGAGMPDGSAGTGGGPGPIDAGPDRGPTCPTGQKLCSGSCVPSNDPANGCAEAACTPCAFPNATAVCGTSGQCAIGTCTAGFGNCQTTDPKDGCETDLSKAETCGSCTTKCDASAPLCSASNGSYQCVTGCMAPTSTLCGSQCVDINTNATHCGACAMPCTVPTNGDAVCATKLCGFACHNGYHKCDATKTCASDTDVNACGATCKKCEAPANGKVSCTSGDCAVSCNANYHACTANNVTTCADDNSPATCGTSCSACPAPTDPNADPAPTCVNKQCGFKCKSSFNLCPNGTCGNFNSVNTCGPTCKVCTVPANASGVSCNGTNCVIACNAGYELSGDQCVLATNLYVSTTGSDSNSGTQASPFRSFKRAAQIAQSGTVINFAPGTYNGAGGDDFANTIPAGVTLQRGGSSGTVTFAADGSHSLTFAGSGTVANITLTNFTSPLTATVGTQLVKGVTITNPKSAISVTGGAVMTISDNSSITGSAGQTNLAIVDGSAQLTLTNTTGATASTAGDCLSAGGILAQGSSTLTLANYTCAGNVWPCVSATGSAVVNTNGSSLVSACGGGVNIYGNASLSATGGTFSNFITGDAAVVTVSGSQIVASTGGLGISINSTGRSSFHGCRFDQQVVLYATAAYDFGSGGGGNNTFNAGLNVQAPSVNVNAAGNKWIPNQQGADGAGNMPTSPIIGPVDGPNVTVVASSLVAM